MRKNNFIVLGQLLIVLLLASYFTFRNIEGLDVGTDEGVHAFTAKTLAFKGRYALETYDEFLDFDRRIAVGPTIIIPTAAVYKLFGFGILQTRTVVGVYFILFIISFFLLARKCFNATVAFITCLLVLSSLWPFWRDLALYIPINRILIGESAALLFLSLGILIFAKGLQTSKYYLKALGTFFLGLAVLTKLQFVLSFPAMLLVYAIFLREKRKEKSLKHDPHLLRNLISILGLITLFFLPLLIWFFIQYRFLGSDEFQETLSSYNAFSKHLFVPSSTKLKQNMIDRWSELMPNSTRIFFIVPALVYGWLVLIKKTLSNNFYATFSLLIATIWLTWFPLSKGFVRYAIPGLFFAQIFLALYFSEQFKKFDIKDMAAKLKNNSLDSDMTSAIFSIALLFILIAYGFYINNRELKWVDEKDTKNMATYIETRLPKEAVIETTELDYAVDLFLKEKRLKHAPAGIRELIRAYKETHDPAGEGVDYIITNPIDKTYEHTLKNHNWVKVARFGSRVLFKLEE